MARPKADKIINNAYPVGGQWLTVSTDTGTVTVDGPFNLHFHGDAVTVRHSKARVTDISRDECQRVFGV